MASESSHAGLYVLLALLIILVLGAILYFSGTLNRKKEIDIKIEKPGVVLHIPHRGL